MANSSITVTDQPSGVKHATRTLTEDALTKHIPRVALDHRLQSPPRKYMISLMLSGSATLGANLLGLRKLAANPDAWISRISVRVSQVAAGLGHPIAVYRATTVAAGTAVAAADIPKKDTAAANATLEVREGAVTGTKSARRILILGTSPGIALGAGSGSFDEFKADNIADYIRLTGDEGLIFDQSPIAGDIDTRYHVTIEWEEGN